MIRFFAVSLLTLSSLAAASHSLGANEERSPSLLHGAKAEIAERLVPSVTVYKIEAPSFHEGKVAELEVTPIDPEPPLKEDKTEELAISLSEPEPALKEDNTEELEVTAIDPEPPLKEDKTEELAISLSEPEPAQEALPLEIETPAPLEQTAPASGSSSESAKEAEESQPRKMSWTRLNPLKPESRSKLLSRKPVEPVATLEAPIPAKIEAIPEAQKTTDEKKVESTILNEEKPLKKQPEALPRIRKAASKDQLAPETESALKPESSRAKKSWTSSNPLKVEARDKLLTPKPSEENCAPAAKSQFEVGFSAFETETTCCQERCCPPRYVGYTAAAVFASAAIAGVVLPDCKTDQENSQMRTLQFVIRYSCEEILPPTAEILLPDMTVFQSYGILPGNNPSNIINNPASGTYTVTISVIETPPECFTIDVILDGSVVISNAPFSGVIDLVFTYTL